MATDVHCLFCFEALSAKLEKREPMKLQEVQKSWAEYLKSDAEPTADKGADAATAKRIPALRRLAESSSSGSSAASSTMSLPTDTPMTSVSSLPTVTESPLFVTWNTLSAHHGSNLRGCIGTFEAQELSDGLSSYALISALHDTRFSPIAPKELPSLEVAVTLLTDFEDAEDAMDWELGTHGLRISFSYHGRRYGSTYLPDVATDQGWDKEETVVSLMRKAGWMGRKDKWRDIELKVVRYQGKARSLPYIEYKAWRDWVDGKSQQ